MRHYVLRKLTSSELLLSKADLLESTTRHRPWQQHKGSTSARLDLRGYGKMYGYLAGRQSLSERPNSVLSSNRLVPVLLADPPQLEP